MRCRQPVKTDKAGCCNPESERCSSQPGNSLKFNIVEARWLSKLSKLVVQVGFPNLPSCSNWPSWPVCGSGFLPHKKLNKKPRRSTLDLKTRIWKNENEKNILYQMGKSYRCKTGTASWCRCHFCRVFHTEPSCFSLWCRCHKILSTRTKCSTARIQVEVLWMEIFALWWTIVGQKKTYLRQD